jgi:hypothetical protein
MVRHRFGRVLVALVILFSLLGGGFVTVPRHAIAQDRGAACEPNEETALERIQRQVDERVAEVDARIATAQSRADAGIAEARARVCGNRGIPAWMLPVLGC